MTDYVNCQNYELLKQCYINCMMGGMIVIFVVVVGFLLLLVFCCCWFFAQKMATKTIYIWLPVYNNCLSFKACKEMTTRFHESLEHLILVFISNAVQSN